MISIVFDFELIVLVWTGLAVPALVSGLMGHDPFGRWGGQGYGPRIGPQLGWFLMELPALLVLPLAYLAVGERHLVSDFLVGVWVAHYAHRTLVWPWIVQQNSDGMPVVTCAAGFGFNIVNGLLLWWSLTTLADYTMGWFGDIRFIAGAVIMLLGAALNIWSDYHLARLRSEKPGHHVLPAGGPFRFVSCPNLTGEMLEWVGFALMLWLLPGLSFAIWTVANLTPRALWRHRWYQERFSAYPEGRRAILPRLL